MGYPIVIEPHPGWKPPTRVARLDDYLRKPKQKSKLSKELREYEEGDTQDEVNSLLFRELFAFAIPRKFARTYEDNLACCVITIFTQGYLY